MDDSYKEQLKDSVLMEKLLDKDKIPVLESLLESKSKELLRLQKLKESGKLDFGRKLKSEELGDLFDIVAAECNKFLDVGDLDKPKMGYYSLLIPSKYTTSILASYCASAAITGFSLFNPGTLTLLGLGLAVFGGHLHSHFRSSFYLPWQKRLVLKKQEEVLLIPEMAHEYAHYVHETQGIDSDLSDIFEEGHARGVERHLSESYREKEDNEAFLYNILSRDVNNLKNSYIWLCNKLGLKPVSNLLKSEMIYDMDLELFSLGLENDLTPHDMGNSLFLCYEAEHGKGIYKDMLKASFEFS